MYRILGVRSHPDISIFTLVDYVKFLMLVACNLVLALLYGLLGFCLFCFMLLYGITSYL
jgi:hypothetical protein